MKLLRPAADSPAARDLALLLSRVALGVVLVAHGWQKLTEWTIAGTADSFGSMGIPAPSVAASYVAGVELVGGAALVLGVLTPVAAGLNAVNMLVAALLVHAKNGVWVADGGYELVLALFAGLVTVTALGAGRFSLDTLLAPSTRRTDEQVPEAQLERR